MKDALQSDVVVAGALLPNDGHTLLSGIPEYIT